MPTLHWAKLKKKLVTTIRDCGVSFDAYLDRGENEQPNSKIKIKYTSLTGDAKKKLLKNLPDKLRGVLNPNTVEDVIQMWKVRPSIYFHDYTEINCYIPL